MTKIKNSIYYTYFYFISILSCNSSDKIERMQVETTKIYDNIESVMPGNLMVFDDYLVWTDPFNTDGYLHIINTNTKKEIANLLMIGEGPEEITTPLLGSSYNKVLVFDINTNKIASLSFDSIYNEQFYPLRYSVNNKTERILGMNEIKKDETIILSFEENGYLHFKNQHFGEIPFAEKAHNFMDILQGKIIYNSQRNYLIYSAFRIPYIVIYELNNDLFTKIHETKSNFDYQFNNNEIKLKNSKSGSIDLAVSKDYIITIQRDYNTDPTEEYTVGRNFNKLPKTIFAYDYQCNLTKIIDLKVPILRIASEENSNTIYAIVVNPDFQIVKFEIN